MVSLFLFCQPTCCSLCQTNTQATCCPATNCRSATLRPHQSTVAGLHSCRDVAASSAMTNSCCAGEHLQAVVGGLFHTQSSQWGGSFLLFFFLFFSFFFFFWLHATTTQYPSIVAVVGCFPIFSSLSPPLPSYSSCFSSLLLLLLLLLLLFAAPCVFV